MLNRQERAKITFLENTSDLHKGDINALFYLVQFRTQKKSVECWYLCRVLVFSRKTVNKLFLVYGHFAQKLNMELSLLHGISWEWGVGRGGSNSLFVSTCGDLISMVITSALVCTVFLQSLLRCHFCGEASIVLTIYTHRVILNMLFNTSKHIPCTNIWWMVYFIHKSSEFWHMPSQFFFVLFWKI